MKCEPQKSLCCFRRKWRNTAPYQMVLVMHKTETRSPGVLSQAQTAFGKPVWQDLEVWLSGFQSFCATLCVTEFLSACCKNRLPQWLIWEWNWIVHTIPWDTLIDLKFFFWNRDVYLRTDGRIFWTDFSMPSLVINFLISGINLRKL